MSSRHLEIAPFPVMLLLLRISCVSTTVFVYQIDYSDFVQPRYGRLLVFDLYHRNNNG